MMHKFGIFDSKKQQGKAVDIFTTKKTQIDLSNQDRNVSPFRGYKQSSANANMPKNQDIGVSRGIFQNKREVPSNDTTPQNRYYTAGTEPEKAGGYTNYTQVFQDFLSNEFKSQIGQFRNEMVQLMNESLKDFHEKSRKNQETIVAIKDSIKNHSHNIEKLDEKIEEYHSSLATISGMFQSEIEKIKSDLPGERGAYTSGPKRQDSGQSQSFNDERLDRVEIQQEEVLKSFEKLKINLTDNVQKTLEEYTQIFEQENEDRINRISNEITKNMEQKVEKVLDHLDGKVSVLEKQIQEYNRTDDPISSKLRFEMEDKMHEHSQLIKQQIDNLRNSIESKAGESFIKEQTNDPKFDEKIHQTRNEIESLKMELNTVLEQVKSEGKSMNGKLQDFEKRFNEQAQQLKNVSLTQKSDSSAPLDTSSKQIREEFERKVGTIERRFEEIRQDQRDLASDISIQKAQLESFKTTSVITMNDLKANQSQLEDVRLKKLESILDQLSSRIDNMKEVHSIGDLTLSTKFSDGSLNNLVKHENSGYVNYPLTSANSYLNAENLPKDQSHVQTYPGQTGDKYSNYSYEKKDFGNHAEKPLSPEKKTHGDEFTNYLPGGALAGFVDSQLTEKKLEQKNLDLPQQKAWEGGNKNDLIPEGKTWEKSSGNSQNLLKNNFIDEQKEAVGKVENVGIYENSIRQGGSNIGGNNNEIEEISGDGEDDEVEVVYQIDENGYLMDEDGQYILDDKGEMIKLNEEQIDKLRENNLLEEESQ